jgi:hypothetical protein
MGLFSRKSSQPTEPTVDMDVARRAAAAVNRGDVNEADRIISATNDPRAHAFAAFRFIDVEEN